MENKNITELTEEELAEVFGGMTPTINIFNSTITVELIAGESAVTVLSQYLSQFKVDEPSVTLVQTAAQQIDAYLAYPRKCVIHLKSLLASTLHVNKVDFTPPVK